MRPTFPYRRGANRCASYRESCSTPPLLRLSAAAFDFRVFVRKKFFVRGRMHPDEDLEEVGTVTIVDRARVARIRRKQPSRRENRRVAINKREAQQIRSFAIPRGTSLSPIGAFAIFHGRGTST